MLLAQKLPAASTFFLTCSCWAVRRAPFTVAWRTTFPGITLLVVIALVYSVISPIINGFTFFAFYRLYKYLFLWRFEQPPSSDTGGLFFPKAITHIFVGLYIQQVCMAGRRLFFLARDQNQNMSSAPQAILIIALTVITVLFQTLISNSFGPLKHALPLSLADKTFSAVWRALRNCHHEQRRAGGARNDRAEGGGGVKRASTMQKTENEEYEGLTDQQKTRNRATRVKSEEDYGFAHPAASRPQRIVWFPHNRRGSRRRRSVGAARRGWSAASKDAEMNEKGKVDIVGAPSDLVLVDQ